MAAVFATCPRCKRHRALFVTPVHQATVTGQTVELMCLECATRERPEKPKAVVTKEAKC